MIIDIRDYKTTTGMRDKFIACCESYIFPEQERLGARILGVFRDTEDEDRVVWLRGMRDMSSRFKILTEFYTNGEMWGRMKVEVNSWIADSDNVLLVQPNSDLAAPIGYLSEVAMYTNLTKKPMSDNDVILAQNNIYEAVKANGGHSLLSLKSESIENNYPRHPIRSSEYGIVNFSTFEKYHPLHMPGVTERHLLPTIHTCRVGIRAFL